MSSTFLRFATTAARLAYTFKDRHIGRYVYDEETEGWYGVKAAGVGAGVFSTAWESAALSYGSPVALTVGGANTDGVSTNVARSDHKHSLPAFSTTAGTFCEGNDSRLSNDRTASGLRSASTVVSVSAATAPAAGQVLVATNSTTASWRSPLTSGVWSADVPPTSPHADDDEFDTGSLSGSWTEADVAGYMTPTVDSGSSMLVMTMTGNGTVRVAGIHKPVAASEWAIYTHAICSGNFGGTGSMAGLWAGQDLTNNPATSDFRTAEFAATNTASAVNTRSWAIYTTAPGATSRSLFTSVYLRMRGNGADTWTDFSPDGRAWFQLNAATLGYTPAEYGLCAFGVDSGVETRCYFRFFRVFSGAGTSGFHATSIGGLLGSFT